MKKKIAVVSFIALFSLGAVYIGAHIYIEKLAVKNFVEFQKSTLYLDGVVFNDVEIIPGTIAKRLYIQGNPIKLLTRNFDRIWMDDLNINQPEWAIAVHIPDVPLEIDHFNISVPVANERFNMVGSLKSIRHHRFVFDLKSTDKRLKLKSRGEIQTKNGKITSVDAEFDNGRLKDDMIKIWRAAGWVNIMHKKDWRITGQLDAGSARVGALDLSDPVLRISGLLSDPTISFSGVNAADEKLVAFESKNKNLMVEYGDNKSQIFNMASFDDNALEKLTKKMSEKPKVKVAAVKIAVAELPSVPETPPIETPAIPVTYKILSTLVVTTPLEGFVYSNPLVYLEQPCADTPDSCWIARGMGGVFGYNADKMPDYMARVQDYELSATLKNTLQHVVITRLTLRGRAGKTEFMAVKGKTPDGKPVHMELSLENVE